MSLLKLLLVFMISIYGSVCQSYMEDWNNRYSRKYEYFENEPHPCTRECASGDVRYCYYKFVVERYMTMNGACGNCPNVTEDCYAPECVTGVGLERSVVVANRKLPGPSIQVCKDDYVIVDIKNMLPGCGTAIHWHGLLQINSKFMDGVPMVTQCPIEESTTFRYHFSVPDTGTYFWHSHSGLQKVDGLVGSLIIRGPKDEDPLGKYYDFDLPNHVMVITDWKNITADSMNPGFQRPGHDQQADTYLIDGMGQWNSTNIPLRNYTCRHGFRYLFRFIAGTCFTCPFTLTMEKHDFLILGVDGNPTKPERVNSLTLLPGERVAAVVHCNKDVGSYYISVRGVGFCASKMAYQLAILTYEGHNGIPSTTRPTYNVTEANAPGRTLNPPNSNCSMESKDVLGPCACDLRSTTSAPPACIYQKPHSRIIINVGALLFEDNKPFTNSSKYPKYIAPGGRVSVSSQVNSKTHVHASSPLLSQRRDVPTSEFCEPDDFSTPEGIARWSSDTELHECVHVIRLPEHQCIEVIIVDKGAVGLSHPMHVHGHNWMVRDQGIVPQLPNNPNATFTDRLLALLRQFDRDTSYIDPFMAKKDTVALTSNGWIRAYLYTNNIGYWLFHCHFAYHLESGMGGVLQVGDDSKMPKPPQGFPRCGNFLPDVKPDDKRDHDKWDHDKWDHDKWDHDKWDQGYYKDKDNYVYDDVDYGYMYY